MIYCYHYYHYVVKSSNSRGANVGVSFNQSGVGYGVSLSLAELNRRVNSNTHIGRHLMNVMIGTPDYPLPLHITAVPIHQALNDNLWTSNDLTSIQQKRSNLQRALEDYASNKRAQIFPGM